MIQQATTQHPTGTAAAATTVLIWLAATLGLQIPAEVAAAIVGLVAVAVSAVTPRFGASTPPGDDDATGPDEIA